MRGEGGIQGGCSSAQETTSHQATYCCRSLNDTALFDPLVGYKVLAGNIGYIYPARVGKVNPMNVRNLLHQTKALIIDFRCYPADFMPFTYGQWLKANSSPFAAFAAGSIDLPGLFVNTGPIVNGGATDAYKGKVIILQ